LKTLEGAQYDALLEVFSIRIGRAASTLNQIVGSHVHMELPALQICQASGLAAALPGLCGKRLTMVSMSFDGVFSGNSGLILPEQDALRLVAALAGDRQDATALDEMRVGALTEVGNIVLNAILGSIANALGGGLDYTVPDFVEDTLENLFFDGDEVAPDADVLIAGAVVQVERLKIATEIVLVLEMTTVLELADALHPVPVGS